MQYKMPAPQFKRQDLIFLILPNEGEIFQNIQVEVKMLDVEVEKKCLCKIPFTPGRGQTGATIWFILRQKGLKIEWTSLLYYIFSFVQQFFSSKLTFIVLSSSIRLNMKFFHAVCVEMGKSSLTVWGEFWSISKRGWVWKRFGNMRFDHLDHCDRSNHQAGRSYHLPKTKFMLKCIFSAVGHIWKGTFINVLSIW